MSNAAPSTSPINPYRLASVCLDRAATGVRATAFWTAAVLPIAVLVALVTGTASQYPTALAGALALNAVCAVVGHEHTPEE
ncbi:MAG: hypothetical protein ACI8UR_001097 [Natronomonas sp.]|jgi:uncharacterized membrane protein YjdF|uniref:hypothetical protein n=1 Tax=Natronomonas sp. TaxID=2184060 RepID=UPI0039893C34